MLTVLDHLPDGMLSAEPTEIYKVLPGPTLIELPGQREDTLFVSVLQHGNEDTGLRALQKILQQYKDSLLPRRLALFVGNVQAARYSLRCLDGQPDFNRVWPGSELAATPEHDMMLQVVARVSAQPLFASIDVHNTTGRNPHYACVNRLDAHYLHLAKLFSRTVVYFIRPKGVLSAALAPYGPSVTLECGKVGEQSGVGHVMEYIDACLHMDSLPEQAIRHGELDLFHSVAMVAIPAQCSFGIGVEAGDFDIRLRDDLDQLNFLEVPEATLFAEIKPGLAQPFVALDEQGVDVAQRYFAVQDNEIRCTRSVMPSMFTLNKKVIEQDCLGYIMERVGLD